jgi:uncharacterized Tic20 family protein
MKEKSNALNVLTHIVPLFFGWILFPLIIFLAVEDKNTKEHSKKSLNWQISLFIYQIAIVGLFISFIFVATAESFSLSFESIAAAGVFALIFSGFVIFSMVVLGILNVIFCILAAVKAGKNELWDYPLAIPFLK